MGIAAPDAGQQTSNACILTAGMEPRGAIELRVLAQVLSVVRVLILIKFMKKPCGGILETQQTQQ